MAAGIVWLDVELTPGNTLKLPFYVDDTVSPTQGLNLKLLGDVSGNPVTPALETGGNLADLAGAIADQGPQAKSVSTSIVFATDAGIQPQMFSVAATQLVRASGTTPYSINDSISNNTTAGSVTSLSATISDTDDHMVEISEIELDTNDTGLGSSGVSYRVYLFNADPTSGVGAGDNAAYTQTRAGLIGTFVGFMVGMSNGGKAFLYSENGKPVRVKPTSSGKLIYVQHQILVAATPSATGTTIDTRLNGIQGRP